MKSKLDKTAKRILYYFDRNARASFAQASSDLDLPEATVRYRFQTLQTSGVITNAYPVFGAGRLGMSVHKFMFKLHKASEQEINRFVDYLSKDGLVNWVARFDGYYDLGCTLLVSHVGELSNFLLATRKRFHANIKQMGYAVNIQAEFFPRDYLIRNSRPANSGAAYRSYPEDDEIITLDEKDWRILRSIAKNVRTPATEIAENLGITSETVGKRLKSLEQRKVITGYRLALDSNTYEHTSYYILLYLNFVSEERLAKMLSYLRSNPAVVYIIKMLGEWDYDVSIELKDANEHRAFVTDLTKEFSDVVRDMHTLTTWHVSKFSIIPA